MDNAEHKKRRASIILHINDYVAGLKVDAVHSYWNEDGHINVFFVLDRKHGINANEIVRKIAGLTAVVGVPVVAFPEFIGIAPGQFDR